MNMSVSFLRWAKKKIKSPPPADVSFFDEFNDCAKSHSPSLRSGSTRSLAPSLNSPYTVSPELDAETKIPQTHVLKEADCAKPDAFVWSVHGGGQNMDVWPQTYLRGRQSLDVYTPPSDLFPGHPSGHPSPDMIHWSTFDHPQKVRPNISSALPTPILPSSMQTSFPVHDTLFPLPSDFTQSIPRKEALPESDGAWDLFLDGTGDGSFVRSDQNNVHAIGPDASQSHDQSSSKRRSLEAHSVNLFNDSIAVCARQLQAKLPSFLPPDRRARPLAKSREHDIIPPSLSALVYHRDTPMEANESVCLEDEGAHFTSDFSLSLFPAPPTSPSIICKHRLPKPPVLCSKVQLPELLAPFTPGTTPPTTPTTPKSPRPHIARNPSSPASILKKPSGGMGCELTINNSPSTTPGSCGFRSIDSKLPLTSRGPGLRLASSSSSLGPTIHRTTSNDFALKSPAQPMPHCAHNGSRQRALSGPEVVTSYSLLTCDAYLNPRPAPKPCQSTAVERVEWGYAV